MVIGCLLLCIVLLLASAAERPAPRLARGDEEPDSFQATYPPFPRPSGWSPHQPLSFLAQHPYRDKSATLPSVYVTGVVPEKSCWAKKETQGITLRLS
jgi:hypothetical protein